MPRRKAGTQRGGAHARGAARVNSSGIVPNTSSTEYANKFLGQTTTREIMGDPERPFLRSSFCKDLHYSFVKHLNADTGSQQVSESMPVATDQCCHLSGSIRGPVLELLPHILRVKSKGHRDLGCQKLQNFLACGAASSLWLASLGITMQQKVTFLSGTSIS